MSDRPELFIDTFQAERSAPPAVIHSISLDSTDSIELTGGYTYRSKSDFTHNTNSTVKGDDYGGADVMLKQNIQTGYLRLGGSKVIGDRVVGGTAQFGITEYGEFLGLNGSIRSTGSIGFVGFLGFGLSRSSLQYTGRWVEHDNSWFSSGETITPINNDVSDLLSYIEFGGALFVIPSVENPLWSISTGAEIKSLDWGVNRVSNYSLASVTLQTRFEMYESLLVSLHIDYSKIYFDLGINNTYFTTGIALTKQISWDR